MVPATAGYVSTPNLLTLAPPGGRESGNPWHLREYRVEEFRAAVRRRLRSVELYGLFHARELRVHELALRAGWGRVHVGLRLTKPFYERFTPAISARDFTLRQNGLERGARLRRGASLTRLPDPPSCPPRPGPPGRPGTRRWRSWAVS